MESIVHNCDCIEFMRSLPDGHYTLAVCDPPYGDAGQGFVDKRGRYGGRFDRYRNVTDRGQIAEIAWDVAPRQEFFDELFRVSRSQIIWGANHFTMPPTKCFLVWRKTNITEAHTFAMCEYAWTSFSVTPKVYESVSLRNPNDLNFHPTQKPIGLYAWIYRLFTKGGDTIFDPMMGSQSSRIAAYFAGLDYEGCELDKYYFDKGCERYDIHCNGIEKIGDATLIQPTLF